MTTENDIPILNRPDFFTGQRLLATDLQSVQAYHRELRWLHNRSLHNWGIAFGYQVTGLRGERTVTLQPGYAIDCTGRDLLLSETRVEPIPAVAAQTTYYLTVSYAEDADLTPITRGGACGSNGAVRRPEEPIVRWMTPASFRHGHDIVVATIEVSDCQLARDVSAEERRDAVPSQQPYVAAGNSIPGQTDWQLWRVPGGDGEETAVGVQATIATSSAGFRDTPRYTAHVMGERVLDFTFDFGDREIGFALGGHASVSAPNPASFELRVLMPAGILPGNAIFNTSNNLTDAIVALIRAPQSEMVELTEDLTLPGLGWHVVWMGVEG